MRILSRTPDVPPSGRRGKNKSGCPGNFDLVQYRKPADQPAVGTRSGVSCRRLLTALMHLRIILWGGVRILVKNAQTADSAKNCPRGGWDQVKMAGMLLV